MGIMSGKVGVVTGAASGNGRAIALKFAEEGARAVVVADIQEEPREGGQPTAHVIRELGVACDFVKADVSDRSAVRAVVAAAQKYGGFDAFVNNAGILRLEDPLSTEDALFGQMFTINVKSAWIGCQEAINDLKRRNAPGSIINISSIAGLIGSTKNPLYNATKAAVHSLSQSFAAIAGQDNIRVNSIHPGIIDTQMVRSDLKRGADAFSIPLKRLGTAAEIADAVVFLSSDRSTYVTATSVVVDGGLVGTL